MCYRLKDERRKATQREETPRILHLLSGPMQPLRGEEGAKGVGGDAMSHAKLVRSAGQPI